METSESRSTLPGLPSCELPDVTTFSPTSQCTTSTRGSPGRTTFSDRIFEEANLEINLFFCILLSLAAFSDKLVIALGGLESLAEERGSSSPSLSRSRREEAEVEEDILGPRTGISLEEVRPLLSLLILTIFSQIQRSLSSNESQDRTLGEQDVQTALDRSLANMSVANRSHGANKSVNFAAKTSICQVLATPQVRKST